MGLYDISASASNATSYDTPFEEDASTVFNFGPGNVTNTPNQSQTAIDPATSSAAAGQGPTQAGANTPDLSTVATGGGITLGWLDIALIGVVVFLLVKHR